MPLDEDTIWHDGYYHLCQRCKEMTDLIRASKRNDDLPLFMLSWLTNSNRESYTANEIRQDIYESAREDGRDIQRA